MKLTILSQYYPPEVGAPQNRLHELAIRLKKEGWDIEVLTAMPNYPDMVIHEKYRNLKYHHEFIDDISVHRAPIYVTKEKGVVKRLTNYFSFVYSSWKVGRKKLEKTDFLMVESPPLFLGISAYFLSKKLGARFIFNVSDLWPESAEKLGIVTNKLFLSLATQLEQWCYRQADFITGQTQGIVKDIQTRFPNKPVYWLPNGVDLTFFKPGTGGVQWRAEKGFQPDDLIFLYAGIHGHAQGLEVILNAANTCKHYNKVHFVFVGDGPEKTDLEDLKEKLKLERVHFFGLVPKSEMPRIVSAADAALVPLKKLPLFEGAIPSKIFENLATEKPIILGVNGEAKHLFIDDGKSGIHFEPEDDKQLAQVIGSIAEGKIDLKTLGANGRVYVNEKFNRDNIARGFIKALEEL